MSSQQSIPSSREPDYSRWRELLNFGVLLLDQPTTNDLQSCIINTFEHLLSCTALLKLDESLYRVERKTSSRINNGSEVGLSHLMNLAYEEKRTILSSDLEQSNSELPIVVAVPLLFRNEILGVLQLERGGGNGFKEIELEFINGLAIQASIALAGFMQKATEHWQIELLSLVKKVSDQIINIYDINLLSKQVTKLILETFNYYFVAIFTIDLGQDKLCFRANAGPILSGMTSNNSGQIESGNKYTELRFADLIIHIGEGIIGEVAKSGMEILANDVSTEAHYRHLNVLQETKSEFALPLKSSQNIFGVLDVQSNKLNAFNDTDTLVLRALADNISTALDNARLYNDLHQKVEQLRLIAEINTAISSILDVNNLMNSIVTLIHRRFNFKEVNIITVQPGGAKILSSIGISQNGMNPSEYNRGADFTKGSVHSAIINAKTILINNITDDIRSSSPIYDVEPQSILDIPILFGEHVLGVLDLQSDSPNTFTPNDVFLFEALADNIAVAIRNANLYRSEQWRRQVADSMREVIGILSADIALDEVLDRILIELEKTLPYDVSAIWLLEETASEAGIKQFTSSLHLAAIHSKQPTSSSGAEIDINQTPELIKELIQIGADLDLSTSTWLSEVLKSQEPIIRTPDSSYEPIGSILSFPKEYSAIAAPLLINDHLIGVLVLAHHLSDKYGIESQGMTATFASYAAVAIENTRLYEAAHDQAWVSTVLLQVAEATQSITNLNELLETVVNIVPGLIGVNACAIYLWDHTIEAFLMTASFGFDADRQAELEKWDIYQGVVPAVDQLQKSGTPVILNTENVTEKIASQYIPSFNLNNELLTLFPMVAQGNLQGAVLVDFSNSNLDKISSQELWDEKFSIIQGISHQTAVAIESIQLIESQEEEAYISVALLQVAQAIASLNQLDEVLGAVVRITPILVGVKRCVIYLWDNNNSVFHLSQSYGFSRGDLNQMRETVSQSEYHFIEIIREQNSIVYHLLMETSESPTSWDRLVSSDFQIADVISQDDEYTGNDESNKEYLKTKSRLLIGFPLTAKGEVLGVMLTEEEDQIKGPPSYHVREKRLEIVKGITQQVAIVIKNELLQQEVIESERMERELQLAREIQTTFLPEWIPDLPGWDLDIRWQPARQVGGDFYDIIVLDPNKLGFVIADVADKGMPAALFMTLIRTLIRAAAKNNTSPAAVLREVNELLLPDAKHGMFVTVVYAIFSLDTGELCYANAGHNPPILKSFSSNELIEFNRTGMALGVLEEIDIGESKIYMNSGDCLLFYTDGVTEAFSSNGEAYGNHRLYEMILNNKYSSAKELLDAIEESINHFIEGVHVSDDLTIAAFIRERLE
jgi:phosphoserine phosphatase RsbU/P